MRNKSIVIFAIAFFCAALLTFNMSYSFFAAPEAEITLRSVHHYQSEEEFENDPTLVAASGLPNVGVGETVYLLANEGNTTITVYSWAITEKPTGSTATLSNASIQNPRFVPDVAGQYLITLSVSNADGTGSPDQIYINAGTFVGVGNISTYSVLGRSCQTFCHTDKAGWADTGHASFLAENMDHGAAYYGQSCISCHTVGFNENAVNNGFDDLQDTYNWTFPATKADGNYASFVTNYPELANLANIQCESCHGPGSQHGAATSKNQIAVSYEVGVCYQCHAGERHYRAHQWDVAAHADVPRSYQNNAECGKCHTAQGFVEHMKAEASTAPYDAPAPITCVACHDPHNGDGENQLRAGAASDACRTCHGELRESSHSGFHHSHQALLVDGTGGFEYAEKTYRNSTHAAISESCVTCHMAETPEEFHVSADSLAIFGEHTFKIVGVTAGGDTLVNSSGCENCHGTVDYEFIKYSEGKIVALLDSLATYLPHENGEPLFPTDETLTDLEAAASHNYYFILTDGSNGIHNPSYASELLLTSIEMMINGSLEGTILSVKDVPNDQGKQVELQWSRFVNEASTTDQIVKYGVWRKAETAMAKMSQGSVREVADMNEMFEQFGNTDGIFFSVNSDIWTFDKEVPATGEATYGVIANTLYDSTITSGQHLSYFAVSGHTADNAVTWSAEANGYSVDNLAPEAPANMSFSVSGSNIVLDWDDPGDTDFNHFAVYRAKYSGFVPSVENRYGYTTDSEFEDDEAWSGSYYYRVSAKDFSGNEGDFSTEISASVTGIGDMELAPDKYGLAQNYPNPFNPETVISYQLPEAASVQLSIFNILGQEVRTLINAYESSGLKQVVWDSRDNSGNTVTPGVYIYKLQAGGFTAIRRMILLK
ncbi:T9SS type A sorting domain-containing protein [candidate division KSB1 bacterium]